MVLKKKTNPDLKNLRLILAENYFSLISLTGKFSKFSVIGGNPGKLNHLGKEMEFLQYYGLSSISLCQKASLFL